MRKLAVLFFAAVFVAFFLTGCPRQPERPDTPETPTSPSPTQTVQQVEDPDKLTFTIKTEKGEMKGELYPDVAPNTVLNFVTLARKGFYDGLSFHRVEPGFVIQGGDPTGTGSGGPGYAIPAEFNTRKHEMGTLAMARTQHPDSAGCQFYIVTGEASFLDGKYTVFGKVTDGMPVALGISKGDRIRTVEISGKLPEDLEGKEVKKSDYKR